MPGLSLPRGQTELPEVWSFDAGDHAVDLALDPGGEVAVAALGSGEVVALDVRTGGQLWRQGDHGGGAPALSVGAKGRLAVGGYDGKVHLYDARGGGLVCSLPVGKGWVEHVAWSPDGTRLAASAGRAVRVFSATGEPALETEPHASTVAGLSWGQRGARLATCCYGGAHLWPLKAGVSAQHLAWKGSLVSLSWSPDERVLACGSQEGTVHFWRLPGGRDAEMSGYPAKPRALAWDAGSTRLATGGGADVCVWDFGGKGPEGTRPAQLKGHQGLCSALAFAPRGLLLASGGQDAGVLLWDLRRGDSPWRFAFLEDEVTGLRWAPRGDALLGADARGVIRRWAVA